MYHFNPSELTKKHPSLIKDPSKQLSRRRILKLILAELLTWKNTPERQFLLQCADWDTSDFRDDKWIAYSPISSQYSYGNWPVYSIDLQYTNGESSIEFESYKGDYETTKYGDVYGNLPYDGARRNMSGTVWTRGE